MPTSEKLFHLLPTPEKLFQFVQRPPGMATAVFMANSFS